MIVERSSVDRDERSSIIQDIFNLPHFPKHVFVLRYYWSIKNFMFGINMLNMTYMLCDFKFLSVSLALTDNFYFNYAVKKHWSEVGPLRQDRLCLLRCWLTTSFVFHGGH